MENTPCLCFFKFLFYFFRKKQNAVNYSVVLVSDVWKHDSVLYKYSLSDYLFLQVITKS